MHYISTRGQAAKIDFADVVLSNLASDGGLYLPESIPSFSHAELTAMVGCDYHEIAWRVLSPFVANAIDEKNLRRLIQESYGSFTHRAVAPLRQADNQLFLLELFHGPTLAFKDVALQLLGRLLDYFLTQRQQKAVIIAATSGDTGSAAIEGCRHSQWLDLFILHPDQKISAIQRRQMTTVKATNVHNIAIDGDFDQAQAIVKNCFRDVEFLPNQHLLAVNSINWARIMAQIVYYFTAAISLGAPQREIVFSVPSGNFGDAFAGFMARQMGLPIKQLIVATNANDILQRLIVHNDFSSRPLLATLAPAMDIIVPSNLERLLFYAYQQDSQKIAQFYNTAIPAQQISVDALNSIRQLFSSSSHDDAAILQTIKKTYQDSQLILDPHTATAYQAAWQYRQQHRQSPEPIVVLATAHPAKFSTTIKQSGIDDLLLPPSLAKLTKLNEHYQRLPAETEVVKNYITQFFRVK